MPITSIQLPDNSVQDINDKRILGIDATPTVNSNNVVKSGGVADYSVQALNTCKKLWAGTQAQYDILTPDSDTLYLITS